MKKILIAVCICSACLLALFAGASAPANNAAAWILLPDTPIYVEASLDAVVLHLCAQNENVVVVGESFVGADGRTWQKVSYINSVEGYVTYDSLYFTGNASMENIKMVKVSPTQMGKKVGLYKIVTEDPVLELSDGENVALLKTNVDYGDYSIVEYNGEQYFVKTSELTDSLTYDQKIAVIIAAAMVGLLISSVAIILLYKRKKMNK